MFTCKSTSVVIACVMLAGCTDPGYRPSSQSVQAVETLQDIEYAGQYMINGFNPCGRPPHSKAASYDATLELERYGNIVPDANIRVRGQC